MGAPARFSENRNVLVVTRAGSPENRELKMGAPTRFSENLAGMPELWTSSPRTWIERLWSISVLGEPGSSVCGRFRFSENQKNDQWTIRKFFENFESSKSIVCGSRRTSL
jgi:hypothetical protein